MHQSEGTLVKFRICQSSAEPNNYQLLASYLVNDVVAIDAGCLGFSESLEAQRRIRHLFLSHSHLDHIASLPMFVEHVCLADTPDEPLTIYGNQHVLDVLRRHIFNDQVWPNMIRLAGDESLHLAVLRDGDTIEVDGVHVTAVALDHVVPTFAFLIREPTAAVAIVTDTAPTDRIWTVLHQTPNLNAVFLEASFPDSMTDLAQKAHHLTTALFVDEIAKLGRAVPIVAVHIKAAFAQQTIAELRARTIPNLQLGEPGKVYTF